MNCDLFSLGKVVVKDDQDETIENHPLNQLLSKPNEFQTARQLKWDYMFWLMMGNAYLYAESFNASPDNNTLYFLNSAKMEFPQDMCEYGDKLFLSREKAKLYKNQNITYKYDNGKETKINFSKILHFSDLSTSTQSWYKGSSVIDALYKVLSNSELALDSKNTNLLFSSKYMVAGKVGKNDIGNPMMGEGEKRDIERKSLRRNPVTAVKSLIDIKRYVEDIGKLKLDESYIEDAFKIGRIYGIPKDVIEASLLNGSTYENQEKARGNHVDYVMSPKGEDFVDGLMKAFNYSGEASMTWEHLPFNYFSKVQKEESEQRKSEALLNLLRAGVSPDDAARQLGYEFENDISYDKERDTETTNESRQSGND